LNLPNISADIFLGADYTAFKKKRGFFILARITRISRIILKAAAFIGRGFTRG
jgi:hypothetical protein